MKTPYSILEINPHYKTYYENQAGGLLPYFSGKTVQKGYGIGSIFSKLVKGDIKPMLQQGARTVGKELLNTGASFISDVLSGKNLKEAAKDNLISGAKNLFSTLHTSVVNPKKRSTVSKESSTKRKASKQRSHPNKKRKRVTDIFS